MERLLMPHIITWASEDMAGTVIENDPDDTEHVPQAPSKTIIEWPSDTRSEIEHLLTDLGAMTEVDVETIVKSRLTKWNSFLQSQIVNAVESTLKDALQMSYLNWNNDLKKCHVQSG